MDTTFLRDSSFIQQEDLAFQAIQRIFPCEEELMDKVPLPKIIQHFQSQIIPGSAPFLIRVAGQSGSGKSSQIVPALEATLKDQNYLKINVGAFAPFHPRYGLWQQVCPAQVREKTNGFALRALVMFYRHCILSRVNIIFDMTLLEPEIDLYLMTLAKRMGYRIQMHVLCVPKKISELFIRLRQKETGRYVRPSSSGYFFNALAPCLRALTHSSLFNRTDRLILWSHTTPHPIKQTSLNNPAALRVLEAYRHANLAVKNSRQLLSQKKKWMKQLLEPYHVSLL